MKQMDVVTFGKADVENVLAKMSARELDQLAFGAIQLDATWPWLSTKRSATCARPACSGASNTARPSPCDTAIGSTEPAMPARNRERDSTTSTRPRRASNCSLRLRTNRGQCAAPGS